MSICKFIILLALMVVYGCQSKQCIIRSVIPINGNKVVVKTIDKCHNRIISEEENRQYSKDSLIRTGYYKEYFKNGNLKESGFLKNGHPDSIAFEYYPNGATKDESYRENGEASGPQYEFYDNGQIKHMFFLKNDSTQLFVVFMNKNGQVDSSIGMPVHLVLQPGYDNLKAGQSLAVVNIICTYRGTHGVLEIKLLKNNKTILDTTVSKFYYFGRQPYYLFKHRVNERGKYSYIVHAKIWNNNNKRLIKADSEQAIFYVK